MGHDEVLCWSKKKKKVGVEPTTVVVKNVEKEVDEISFDREREKEGTEAGRVFVILEVETNVEEEAGDVLNVKPGHDGEPLPKNARREAPIVDLFNPDPEKQANRPKKKSSRQSSKKNLPKNKTNNYKS